MPIPAREQSIEGIASDTSLSLGQGGAVYVSDTTETKGNFGAIQAVADAVFATLVAGNWTGTTTSMPLPAGVTIFGNFTSFTLTSGGKVIAYKNV